MLENISDDDLLGAYQKAKEMNLDTDFIELLENELLNRTVDINPD
ncbi:sporulation histidine kinase inhibitor Sda [Bacillus solitudinis]|nr:sporulation histidine kinase inhibitor Sda [Bacillus solitudinis]